MSRKCKYTYQNTVFNSKLVLLKSSQFAIGFFSIQTEHIERLKADYFSSWFIDY